MVFRKSKNVGTGTLLSPSQSSEKENINVAKKSRMRYSSIQKVEILNKCDMESDPLVICQKYKISDRTLRDWKKNKNEIIEIAKHDTLKNVKKLSSSCNNLDDALFIWVVEAQQKGLPISGPILRQKALNLNRELGGSSNFKASEGWLHKWKCRKNVRTLRITGEKLSADAEAADKYKIEFEKMISSKRLTRAQVFNFDESGLYFKQIPKKTFAPKNVSQVSGTKKQIERVTIAACCNGDGSFKLPLLFIGKSKNPRCLKNENMNALPVVYKNQHNAWVDKDIFQSWFEKDFVPNVKEFLKSRNLPLEAVLVIDNCRSHKFLKIDGIEVVFLAPNVTSIIQPLDQGILQCLKVNYQFHLVNSVLESQTKGISLIEHLKSLTIRHVIFWIAEAWEKLSSSTIYKCWNKLWSIKRCDIGTQTDEDETTLSLLDASVGADSEDLFHQKSTKCNDLLQLIKNVKSYENIEGETLFQYLMPLKPQGMIAIFL